MKLQFSVFAVLLIFTFSCDSKKDTLFEEIPADQTGIDFVNRSLEKKEFNIFNYRNFYNGGGVAIGDINQDGLADVFVTSNFEDNKLYLNKGDFKFQDITKEAGIVGKKFWSTGVTFADVNGDGNMDIYVCNSGSRDERGNQLYINSGVKNGIPQFKEVAKESGLADGGFSTHAAFFDYDRDGDLDMYLLNNSFTPIDKLGYMNLRETRDALGGDKLFRNDSPDATHLKFTDVSESAGIYGSLIGFGLGITIGDVNNDNWPDIYISNDFYERDYLYINQKNGTFKEDLVNQMPHISLSSMGADIADINDDGKLDIFVTDMLPGDDYRLKTTSIFEGHNLVKLKEERGFWHQYMRNNLHLNNGDDTFSEIGQFSGVHATDWSWGALIFDMDNDGSKDIFVANGIAKDLTDQDFVDFLADRSNMQQMLNGKKFDYKEFVDKISSVPIPNYAFKNQGNLKFKNVVDDWGLKGPGFSNGSAYGDLDNDGDLDLIVNNVNSPLSVYKNKTTEKLNNHYLTVSLKGEGKNLNGIGAKVTLYSNGQLKYLQQMPNRGFQSSCDLKMVFGLGNLPKIDSLQVIWPNDKMQIIQKPKINSNLTLDIKNATLVWKKTLPKTDLLFVDDSKVLDYKHVESPFTDFDRDILIKQKLSTQGPALATGDVNGDGLDDVYLGGAAGQDKKLFVQSKAGLFMESKQADFSLDKTTENTDAVFFDADGDKDLDLYVVTGSNEFIENASELHDLLYINDGKGKFSRSLNLPQLYENGASVSAGDFDKDGDVDLFVASRMISGKYGMTPSHNLLVNDGHGGFKNLPKRYIPDLAKIGMVTDTQFADVNGDGYLDLLIAQDWGPILVLENKRGRTFDVQPLEGSEGLWKTIEVADIDQDGDLDFVAGNQGENCKLQVSNEHPAQLLAKDLDQNGIVEQIISCYTEDGNTYPMVLKGELQRAVPSIKKKFIKYKDYAKKTVEELFTEEQREGAEIREVKTLQTVLYVNQGNMKFTSQVLPTEAQFAPMNAIVVQDFDGDKVQDILLAGNFFDSLPEWGRFDGTYGLFLKGLGKNQFKSISNSTIGLRINGQARAMKIFKTAKGKEIIVAKNNENAQVIKLKK